MAHTWVTVLPPVHPRFHILPGCFTKCKFCNIRHAEIVGRKNEGGTGWPEHWNRLWPVAKLRRKSLGLVCGFGCSARLAPAKVYRLESPETIRKCAPGAGVD